MVSARVLEAQQVRSRFEPVWNRANYLFEGDHYVDSPDTRPELTRAVLNRTNRATVALAATLAQSRPSVDIKPREVGDAKLYYMQPEVGAQILVRGAQLPSIDRRQLLGDAPMLKVQAQALIQSGMVGENAFIEVDDAMVADMISTINDTMWEASGEDFMLAEAIQQGLITGTQPRLIQWDTANHQWQTFNPHIKNVWIDPSYSYIDRAQYVVYAELIDADRVRAIYPNLSDKFVDSQMSSTARTVVGTAQMGYPYTRVFHRGMVQVVHAWLRDQMVNQPLMADEAMRRNLVQMQPDGSFIGPGNQPLEYGGQGWPTEPKRGIRQITLVGQEVVEDIACPYRDIPMSWFVNIPRYGMPYGMGEPEFCDSLQVQLNRMLSIFVNTTEQYQCPMETVPASVKQQMGDSAYENMYSFAGRRITLPDQLFMQLQGRASMFNYPPPLNESYMNLFQILLAEFDRFTGYTDVMRGSATPDATSGRAIGLLQDAATKVIAYRALWLERSIMTQTRIATSAIVDFLPADMYPKYVGKYPPSVWKALRSRAKDLNFDISASVTAGKDGGKRQQYADAMALYQNTQGQAVTIRTLQEKSGVIDHVQEADRMRDQMAQAAQAQAQAQMAMIQQTQQSQQQPPQ